MNARKEWQALAGELDLSFNAGARGMLESKLGARLAAQQGQDPAKLEAVLDSSLLMMVFDQMLIGVISGQHDDEEFYIYRSSTNSSGNTATYAVHVQLFFPDDVGLGLSIYHERFWSRVGKFFGAQDIVLGHDELDPLVMIKAENDGQAKLMLSGAEVQGVLLDLFQHSDGFEVDDNGIEHRTPGERILDAERVVDLMGRMAAAAKVLHPVLSGKKLS